MRDELLLPQGKWQILETDEDGDKAQELTNTAIGVYMKGDLRHGADTAYYVFIDNDGAAPVCLGIGESISKMNAPGGTALVTGYGNADPYAAHADVIKALGDHLGVDLGPHCYPYKWVIDNTDDVDQDAGPSM